MDVRGPSDADTDADRTRLARIAETGWLTIHAAGEGDQPPRSHTAGISSKLGAPELILFGLPETSAELLMSTYVRELELGGLITSGRAYRTFLDGLSVQFLDLDPSDEVLRNRLMPWTFWYYRGADIPVMQLVWPDAENRMPWDESFDARLSAYQPLLGLAPDI